MPPVRDQNGTWSLVIVDENDRATQESSDPSYLEALPRYLTLFDPAFIKAKERSEFAFIQTLLAVRGLQDPGWKPYETSLSAINEICAVHAKAESYTAKRHLELWLFGHAVEASEPYEILANLIDISQGGTFHTARFPPNEKGVPQFVDHKIAQLEKAAKSAGMPGVVTPLQEVWDRELRNAIFHSDYSLHGGEVRFTKAGILSSYGHDKIVILVNRALAYFTALRWLRSHHISSYTEPKEVAVHPLNAGAPNERAIVMVREGHGAIGLKDAWTEEDVRAGRFHWRIAHYSEEERQLADADPMRTSFPARVRPG
jgi:hypothetical protein